MWIPWKIPYWSSTLYCVSACWRPECTGCPQDSRIGLSTSLLWTTLSLHSTGPDVLSPPFPHYYTTNISICWILLSHYSHSFTVNSAEGLKSSVRVHQQPWSSFSWAYMNTCVVHSLCTALYTSLGPYGDGYDIWQRNHNTSVQLIKYPFHIYINIYLLFFMAQDFCTLLYVLKFAIYYSNK